MERHWIYLVFIGILFVFKVPALSQNPNEMPSQDFYEIQQIRAALDTAWNRHDAAALAELFLEDADFQWHTGELLINRFEIEKYFDEQVFKFIPSVYRHQTTFHRIRLIDHNVAIGDGTIVVSMAGDSGIKKPYLDLLFTCIGKKEKQKWYIAAVRLIQVTSE